MPRYIWISTGVLLRRRPEHEWASASPCAFSCWSCSCPREIPSLLAGCRYVSVRTWRCAVSTACTEECRRLVVVTPWLLWSLLWLWLLLWSLLFFAAVVVVLLIQLSLLLLLLVLHLINLSGLRHNSPSLACLCSSLTSHVAGGGRHRGDVLHLAERVAPPRARVPHDGHEHHQPRHYIIAHGESIISAGSIVVACGNHGLLLSVSDIVITLSLRSLVYVDTISPHRRTIAHGG